MQNRRWRGRQCYILVEPVQKFLYFRHPEHSEGAQFLKMRDSSPQNDNIVQILVLK
jgi:hypothetical protein